MSLVLALLVAAAADQRVVFTRYEVKDPSEAQVRAFDERDRQQIPAALPITDRVELRLSNGQSKRFSSEKLNGYASLEVDSMGYLLRFDSGSYVHKSPALLEECQPLVYYAVKSKVGGRVKLTAEQVVIGNGC